MSQDDELTSSGKRGRPRSEVARKAILKAARDILTAEGLGRLTVEAVAGGARVGKPTIYRSWRNAQELAMAAFLADPPGLGVSTQSLSTRARLVAQMERLVEVFATARGRQITLTMAAADPDSEIAKAFRTQVLLKCREEGREILVQAMARGEVDPAVEVETVLDVLYAPVFYRLLVGHLPLSKEFGRAVVDAVFSGIGKPAD